MTKALKGNTGINDFDIETGLISNENTEGYENPASKSKINPLNAISYDNIPGAVLINHDKDVFDRINFEDRTFILREAPFDLMIKDLEVEALANSIFDIGLINPIYIQQTIKDGEPAYRIISGYRRSCALAIIRNQISEVNAEAETEDEKLDFNDISAKYVLVPQGYTSEDLDVLQVNENSHRQNLKTIELAYRLHTYAEKNKLSINAAAEKYNISQTQGKRLISSLKYPAELKIVLDKIGPSRAEELNRLIKIMGHQKTTQSIIEDYIDLSRDELRNEYKNFKAGVKKEYIIHKHTKKNFSIKIEESLSIEEFSGLMDLVKTYLEDLKK